MKILHTSDWHLGQYFMMKSREAEHFAFLNWLVETIKSENIDAIIVAGDIFDSTSPPSYARKLYSEFIVNLQRVGCTQLIIVSGNHDSVAVLNESKSLLSVLNVSVLAGLSDNLEDHLITLKDKNGDQEAIVCALPFLRQADLLRCEFGLSAQQKQLNLQKAIQKTYQNIYKLAKVLNKESPLIATGHLTAVGCSVSESVRDIYIGTLTAFPASLFPNFDYIALGHLHRAQCVQKNEKIRYSGSPIALSFDESKQTKLVEVLEFSKSNDLKVNAIEIPTFQQLLVIKGDLDSVRRQLIELKTNNKTISVWVEIKLQQNNYQADLQAQLNELITGCKIEILKISCPQINENKQWKENEAKTLEALTVTDLFQHRLDGEENLSEQQQAELHLLFAQVCSELELCS